MRTDHSTLTARVPGDFAAAPRSTAPPRRTHRGWAWAGIGAGLAGIGSIVGSSLSGAVYEDAIAGDAAAIADRLAEQTPQIMLFHTATMTAVVLLVVFAAGLRRMLTDALPEGSLLPSVASSGLLLVAVAGLMGSALTTEFVFAAKEPDLMVVQTFAVFGHWIGTVPWLWGTAGFAAVAVAVAALRHGAAPRWLGYVSVVLGGLALLLAVSPLQYMAGMVGPLWLTLASVGLLRSRQ
jgi:MFS family permease